MERTIVIGDVHGCYFELMALLEEIRVRDTDRLISVGDLIAKGPANREVLEFVRHQRNCESVMGNNEHLLWQYYCGQKSKLEPAHYRTIAELGKEFGDYMDMISRFPYYIELGNYLVVHAGIRPGVPLQRQTVEDLTRLRTLDYLGSGNRTGTPWFERYRGEKTVIFGHRAFDTPLIQPNAIGIDTGCVYGGSLTAVLLPERRLVSIPAVRAYATKRGESPCLRE